MPFATEAINIACGAGQMSYRRFLLFDSLGAVLWSTQAALIGYFAGRAFADQVWVALAVAIAVGIAVGFVVILRERRMVAREDALEAAEDRAATLSREHAETTSEESA